MHNTRDWRPLHNNYLHHVIGTPDRNTLRTNKKGFAPASPLQKKRQSLALCSRFADYFLMFWAVCPSENSPLFSTLWLRQVMIKRGQKGIQVNKVKIKQYKNGTPCREQPQLGSVTVGVWRTLHSRATEPFILGPIPPSPTPRYRAPCLDIGF